MGWGDDAEDPTSPEELFEQPAPSSTEHSSGGGERPRLHLMPRGATAASTTTATASGGGGGGSKSNPFGAAKPREEVLASKGIDASLVDKRVELKASVPRLTAEQDRQVEAMRTELTDIEEKLREANEMELPEEDLRIAAEEKRSELNLLVKGFHELNLKERTERKNTTNASAGTAFASTSTAERRKDRVGSGGGGVGSGAIMEGNTSSQPPLKFERPSERRRRLEQQRRENGGDYPRGGGSHGGGVGGRGGGGRRYNDYDDGGGDDPYSSFGGNRTRGGRGDGGGGGGGYNGDRRQSDNRGGGGRGGYSRDDDGGYNQYGGDRGGRRSNEGYNDKYAGDRYNY